MIQIALVHYRITNQGSQALFLVRGLHEYHRGKLRIGVARILAMNREHMSWNVTISEWPRCWTTRELRSGRVG